MQIVNEYKTLDWHEIYTYLQTEDVPQTKQHFANYIHFLKVRIPEMNSILSQGPGIKPTEIPLRKMDAQIKESKRLFGFNLLVQINCCS